MASGHVNLLGDYTDINDGFVLPMTVDRGVYLAVCKRPDQAVRIYWTRYEDMVEYPLGKRPTPKAGLWVILHSGVKRSLAASAYNERHSECAQAVAAVVVMSSPRTTVFCAP